MAREDECTSEVLTKVQWGTTQILDLIGDVLPHPKPNPLENVCEHLPKPQQLNPVHI